MQESHHSSYFAPASRLVLEYASPVWHSRPITAAGISTGTSYTHNFKFCSWFSPYPYGVNLLPSWTQWKTDKSISPDDLFFKVFRLPSSCHHCLFPPLRDALVITRLFSPDLIYKKYQSFIIYGLHEYQSLLLTLRPKPLCSCSAVSVGLLIF